MKPLLFSIITPTHNRGYLIWKAIQSVQRQHYPYWELLIVDDGSTDDTEKVVAEFQRDPRIHYFFQKKSGGCIARNHGMAKAKGDFIVYLDSDDRLYDIYLSTVLEYFNKYPDKVFAMTNYNRRLELYDENYRFVDFTRESSSQKEVITLSDIYNWNIFTTGSGVVHKRKISKEIRWDKNIKRAQDWDFLLTLGKYYPEGFLHIPYVLFEYVQKYGGDAMCSQASYQDWAECFEAMYQKHKHNPLMKGQTWYPKKVEKYRKLQEKFEKGEVPPAYLKDFPIHVKKPS